MTFASSLVSALLAFALAPGAHAAVTCTYTSRIPKPAGAVCGMTGVVANGKVLGASAVTADIDTCRTRCFDQTACLSYGFVSKTSECTLYTQTLSNFHITHTGNQASLYDRRCFVQTCATVAPPRTVTVTHTLPAHTVTRFTTKFSTLPARTVTQLLSTTISRCTNVFPSTVVANRTIPGTPTPTATCKRSLLVNGDFSGGNIAPWTIGGPAGYSWGIVTPGDGDEFAVNITVPSSPTGAMVELYQDKITLCDKSYIGATAALSFAYLAEQYDPGAYIIASVVGVDSGTSYYLHRITGIPAGQWFNFDTTFTIGNAASVDMSYRLSFTFDNSNHEDSYHIDNVYLTVQPPSRRF